jgi:predicted hydrocarbon binding protein
MPDAIRESHVSTGYRWEATVFLTTWQEIEIRYGRAAAKDICGKAMYEAGVLMGRSFAKVRGKADLVTLKSVWEELYSTEAGAEWDGKRFVVKGSACFIRETLRGYELAPDLLGDIQEVFCDGDRGFVNGFNPNLRFAWGGRVMRGDPRCVWIIEAATEAKN